MDRTVKFLLNNYYYKDNKTERLAPGELWSTEHAAKNMREQRTYERLNKLETIVNERTTKSRGTFQLPLQQKNRARHLIKHLDFYLGQTTEEQYIVMIIIYVKLESNPRSSIIHYHSLLEAYNITMPTFVKFLVNLNKYHIEN